jgi:uncharacterized membrane protein
MFKQFIPFLTSSAILLTVDVFYLYNVGMKTFQNNVQLIQKSPLELNVYGALLSYICVVGVLYYFIISQRKPVTDAFLLGIFLYGTFDMTNLAMFKKYAWRTAITDTLWGGTLFAFTTWATYRVLQ